jgi:hypothetical protein
MDRSSRLVCCLPWARALGPGRSHSAYNSPMILRAVLFFTAFACPLSAQLVDLPPGESLKEHCARVEQIKPNLVIARASSGSGRIIDGSGTPLQKSPVELRTYQNESRQIPIRKIMTDANGNFDLAVVAKGRYRLLASPSRLFRQAEDLSCGPADKCTLQIVLRVSSTDMPESVCPVR